jgi:hypothetical protein
MKAQSKQYRILSKEGEFKIQIYSTKGFFRVEKWRDYSHKQTDVVGTSYTTAIIFYRYDQAEKELIKIQTIENKRNNGEWKVINKTPTPF